MDEKKRLSLYVPVTIYDRLNTESEVCGISKSTIVLKALLAYYHEMDSKPHGKVFKDSAIRNSLKL